MCELHLRLRPGDSEALTDARLRGEPAASIRGGLNSGRDRGEGTRSPNVPARVDRPPPPTRVTSLRVDRGDAVLSNPENDRSHASNETGGV
ncbi:hypothetical protein ANANG_G00280630 [Anguilla anguilla]|uniref:Uncharacterized protein n=1 Tax=Anguilla anguilla TaxID=7936 RepID=A0A9D3LSG1_ANGAN|nr:hypothetical protein ANANG_G00280630 [Anguilla anguilla]